MAATYTRLDGQPMHAQTFVCDTCQHTAIGPVQEAEARIRAHVATHAPVGYSWACPCGTTYYAPTKTPGERLITLQATHLEMHAMTEEK